MRTVFQASSEILVALITFASFAIFAGGLAATYAHSVRTGLLIAGTAFISASLAFIYSMWRLNETLWSGSTANV
jgi:hypothetical protein